MHSLDDLLQPISPEHFLGEYVGRKPLHIPASGDGAKASILTWPDFNRLLGQGSLWTSAHLRLMRNYVAVPPDQYCHPVATPQGEVLRPWPQKVEVFLSAGASLIANDVLSIHEPLMRIGETLSRTFAASIGANIYCSFRGVQAFGTHFDNHDVIVIQTGGTKVWNLYASRADNPIENFPDDDATRRWFEQTRGPLMQQVTMQPGDVLYLPRGWYHDALATDGPSLHVTFAITPLHGRTLLSLLNLEAMKNPAYRAFAPPATEDGGAALAAHLAEYGQILARIAASPAFREEVARSQTRMTPRPPSFTLPERKPITLIRTTGRSFPDCSSTMREIYDWAISERQFALEDMVAQFQSLSEDDVRAGVAAAEAAGALQRV
jgi:bifunctional lysine-specific demethylase and histidyl-hydroxylase NO66